MQATFFSNPYNKMVETIELVLNRPVHRIEPCAIEEWRRRLQEDKSLHLLIDPIWNSGLRPVLVDHRILNQSSEMHLFSDPLKPTMTAADQMWTGLCWAFAGLGGLRRQLALRHSLPADFELSQTYILFYDKLEKAHAFLTHVHQTKALPADDRTVHHLLHDPIPDGGSWESFEHLVRKYGIVPRNNMDASYSTNNTHYLQQALRIMMLQTADRIRNGTPEPLHVTIERVHRLLIMCLGTPPVAFEWIRSEKGQGDEKPEQGDEKPEQGDEKPEQGDEKLPAVRSVSTTPLALLAEAGMEEEMVVVAHMPTKPANHRYVVAYYQTVLGYDPVAFVNVDEDAFHETIVNAVLNLSVPVWFASEFGHDRLQNKGVLHHQLMHYERVIGEAVLRDKASRCRSRAIEVNHAMLITGCHVENGTVVRWQVENSHGSDSKKGYLSMSDQWLREHVFYVAVPRRALASRIPPPERMPLVTVNPWDEFGIVARVGERSARD